MVRPVTAVMAATVRTELMVVRAVRATPVEVAVMVAPGAFRRQVTAVPVVTAATVVPRAVVVPVAVAVRRCQVPVVRAVRVETPGLRVMERPVRPAATAQLIRAMA
jgi:hypothetical protein